MDVSVSREQLTQNQWELVKKKFEETLLAYNYKESDIFYSHLFASFLHVLLKASQLNQGCLPLFFGLIAHYLVL